jgi:hypothetical protein
VGEDALVDYRTLSSGNAPCPASATRGALLDRPVGGHCGLTLNDTVPNEQADDAAQRLNSALAVQQRRLAERSGAPDPARGGERLDRFVEIVQAADTRRWRRCSTASCSSSCRTARAARIADSGRCTCSSRSLWRTQVTEEQVDSLLRAARTAA